MKQKILAEAVEIGLRYVPFALPTGKQGDKFNGG
jgi:hypothetical protein